VIPGFLLFPDDLLLPPDSILLGRSFRLLASLEGAEVEVTLPCCSLEMCFRFFDFEEVSAHSALSCLILLRFFVADVLAAPSWSAAIGAPPFFLKQLIHVAKFFQNGLQLVVHFLFYSFLGLLAGERGGLGNNSSTLFFLLSFLGFRLNPSLPFFFQ
jgi:hypothetical protein